MWISCCDGEVTNWNPLGKDSQATWTRPARRQSGLAFSIKATVRAVPIKEESANAQASLRSIEPQGWRFSMRWMRCLLMLLVAGALQGCAIVQVSVRNPVVGLEKVAVAPFFNLSSERAASGYDFAEAYYTELQKVPGFEVVPVGITDRVIKENQLTMEGPDDALRLAKILNVDAVVVGAVTDYDPYVPRVGLKVSWYSNQDWEFLPNIPASEQTSNAKRRAFLPESLHLWGKKTPEAGGRGVVRRSSRSTVVRGQSPNAHKPHPEVTQLFDPIPEGNWQAVGHQQVEATQQDDGFLPPRDRAADARPATATSFQPTSQPRIVGQEFTYEVVPGPLFGEPRVFPNSAQTPVATVIEDPEFVSFNEPGVVVMEPVILESEVVLVEGPADLPAGLPYETNEAVSGGPLPLPLPPNPIVVGASEPARATQPQTPPQVTDSPATLSLPANQPVPRQPQPQGAVQELASNERPADRVAMNSAQVGSVSLAQPAFDPRQPLMSYVRMFDGTDANLVARLSDYLELSGETRTGDVSAFIRRSDFFQKFTAHVMISEMLSLHGGESRRRWVMKSRQFR